MDVVAPRRRHPDPSRQGGRSYLDSSGKAGPKDFLPGRLGTLSHYRAGACRTRCRVASTPQYAKQREAGTRCRDRQQADYVEDFHAALLEFLAFDSKHASLAERLAKAVTEHATPVGSGTVARTKRIPIERRAEAAVIAWLRHATTGYDGMVIPRIKGKRREVRRMLAEQSRRLLRAYRAGETIDLTTCPLANALNYGAITVPSIVDHAVPIASQPAAAPNSEE